MKVTEQQIEAAYYMAQKVYDGEKKLRDGALSLAENYGLNKNSATDFINNYKKLRDGNIFKRTMSSAGIVYFLDNIHKDNGVDALKQALTALKLHIEYYENYANVTSHTMRRIFNNFERMNKTPESSSDYAHNFNEAIITASHLSSAERKKRISEMGKTPTKIKTTTYVFYRNPYVVAERLKLANGICEYCKKDAPFTKAKDGTPYLEVHHKKRLADGGEDTVENTIALCPNCHRMHHHGNPA